MSVYKMTEWEPESINGDKSFRLMKHQEPARHGKMNIYIRDVLKKTNSEAQNLLGLRTEAPHKHKAAHANQFFISSTCRAHRYQQLLEAAVRLSNNPVFLQKRSCTYFTLR